MTTLDLNGIQISVPDDHLLLYIRRTLPDYAENVGRAAAVVERKYPGRGLVDVGANVGDTAAVVRSHTGLPILSIEGSPYYFELLQANARSIDDVELECALVDSVTACTVF